jgi:iron-sulfur cluster assembly protein
MPITLTEKAAKTIQGLLRDRHLPATACLRVGVKGGGCAGMSYTLDITDGPAAQDEAFVSHGVTLVCDPKGLLSLDGTEIDYNDSLVGGGFVFHNPHAKETCGCGGSFST